MLKHFCLFILTSITFGLCAQSYSFEKVDNDPTKTRIYTLKNGLKVYLSKNDNEPRVYTNVAVRAGSKYDPADATGLAHYLEHMLFKGNSQIASKDWSKEKVYLQKISDLYEAHKSTSDTAAKKRLYRQIDSLSGIAAKFAVANEYDKMVSSIGASGTNAYTSTERTVYINEIPSNELEKWMLLESTRFKELCLRIFHTELEAVYEEYNRSRDNDISKLFEKIHTLMWQKHPYGTQTTIGTSEHLKNPSMVKIHEYFTKYYVPNNMAIMIAGDIDYDKTIALIDKYFGAYQEKDIPPFTFEKEEPITSVKSAEVTGPNFEVVMLGYRFDGAGSKDEPMLTLLDYMLSNSSAGLIDLNLNQKQKVLQAGSFVSIDKDYSAVYLYGIAKQGQSLEEVRSLLLKQFEQIKQGDFDDWMLEACLKNMALDQEKSIESNRSRCSMMTESFILEKPWKDIIFSSQTMSGITKAQLVGFVKQNFNDNYVYVEKKTGKDADLGKVKKPAITPIEISRDEQSEFAKSFYSMATDKIEPVYVDYKTAIKHTKASGVDLYSIENKTNKTFSLTCIFDMGTYHNDTLGLVSQYLPYLGCDKYSAEELKKNLFKLGLDMTYSASAERFSVSLSGLESSLDQGMAILNAFFNGLEPNASAYNEMIKDIIKSREDAKLDKAAILRSAMLNYAKFGKKSPFTDIFSEEALKNIDPNDLVRIAKHLFDYKKRIFFYGKTSPIQVKMLAEQNIPNLRASKAYPPKKHYNHLNTEENKVYFTHFDMVQSEMLAISNVGKFNASLPAFASMHNNYFGGGLSSIVFQEIRESKALAYSARNSFSVPSKKEDPCYVSTYIGTQVDKLPEAVDAMNALLAKMPQSEGQFQDSKQSTLKQIATNRITKSGIFWNYERVKKLGFDYDYRKDVYQQIEKMSLSDLNTFFNQYMQTPKTYLVIGDKEKVNFEALKTLGEVKELSLEEIFGY